MEPQVDNWDPSVQTDQETQVGCPGILRRGRAEMWRLGEKEEEEVGEGTEGGREEGGRGKIWELSNSLPQVSLECEV